MQQKGPAEQQRLVRKREAMTGSSSMSLSIKRGFGLTVARVTSNIYVDILTGMISSATSNSDRADTGDGVKGVFAGCVVHIGTKTER